jgi:hypothetical protein
VARTGLGEVQVALQPYVVRNWLVSQGLVTTTWAFVLSLVPGRWHVPNTRLPPRDLLVISAASFQRLHCVRGGWPVGVRIGLRELFLLRGCGIGTAHAQGKEQKGKAYRGSRRRWRPIGHTLSLNGNWVFQADGGSSVVPYG